MCLAIPMEIKKIIGDMAKVERKGLIQDVNIQLVPNVKIGDYVLVHAGFAIKSIDKKWAKESSRLWKKLK